MDNQATDYDKIEAGDELNALIEVKIFGGTCARCEKQPASHIVHSVVYCSPDCFDRIGDFALDDYQQRRKRYSESWDAAGEVVEKLRERYPVTIEIDKDGYHCEIWSDFVHSSHYRQIAEATAETFQLAVSRIALKVADSLVREGEG